MMEDASQEMNHSTGLGQQGHFVGVSRVQHQPPTPHVRGYGRVVNADQVRNDARGGAPHETAIDVVVNARLPTQHRSEEHTSELQSLMRISYAVFCLKKKKTNLSHNTSTYKVYSTSPIRHHE